MPRPKLISTCMSGAVTLLDYLKKTLLSDFGSFFKWLLLSLIAGGSIGLAGTAFHLAVSWGEGMREAHWWLPLLLPLGGLAIAFLYGCVFTGYRDFRFIPIRYDRTYNLILYRYFLADACIDLITIYMDQRCRNLDFWNSLRNILLC